VLGLVKTRDAIVALLLTSPFLLAKYAWDALAQSGDGRFVLRNREPDTAPGAGDERLTGDGWDVHAVDLDDCSAAHFRKTSTSSATQRRWRRRRRDGRTDRVARACGEEEDDVAVAEPPARGVKQSS